MALAAAGDVDELNKPWNRLSGAKQMLDKLASMRQSAAEAQGAITGSASHQFWRCD